MTPNKRVTVPWVIDSKGEHRKLSMLTAYDYLTASLLDEAGIDILLVGDSMGNVIQGKTSTIPVTLEQMIYHTEIVSRSTQRALVIGDMPFGTYSNVRDAVTNAIRLMKDGGCQAIKLEGGKRVLNQVRAIINSEIPVMGHLGLTPQSEHKFGGHKVQARSEYAVQRLVSDALALEEAGVFAIVLEGIPTEAAQRVTEALKIPTIGIGAGVYCDGQVLVTHDMLGMTDFTGRFVKQFAVLREQILSAVKQYKDEVEHGQFPTPQYSYELEIEDRDKADILDAMKDYKELDREPIDEF